VRTALDEPKGPIMTEDAAVPARVGARRPAAEILQVETA
jgi:hypothetical protein